MKYRCIQKMCNRCLEIKDNHLLYHAAQWKEQLEFNLNPADQLKYINLIPGGNIL